MDESSETGLEKRVWTLHASSLFVAPWQQSLLPHLTIGLLLGLDLAFLLPRDPFDLIG